MATYGFVALRAICLAVALVLPAAELLGAGAEGRKGEPSQVLRDKTLVVWAAPANLTQRAGSALTLDDLQTHFDGIVFAELTPGKWMAGSDTFSRTSKEQKDWPDETADATTFVQMAIVYRGTEVTVYRNGQRYARYTMPNPPRQFGPTAGVLLGRRHLDAGDPENSFAGGSRMRGSTPTRSAGRRLPRAQRQPWRRSLREGRRCESKERNGLGNAAVESVLTPERQRAAASTRRPVSSSIAARFVAARLLSGIEP